jgi:transposase-like protein
VDDIELIERRDSGRRLSEDEKIFLVRESFRSRRPMKEFCRQNGVGISSLLRWRKQFRDVAKSASRSFVPVKINDAAPELSAMPGAAPSPTSSAPPDLRRMEITLPGGIGLRIDGEVSETALRGVLAALRMATS